MKSKQIPSESGIEYQNLLDTMSCTAKYLEGLNVEPTRIKSYKKLLRYLRSLPAETISEILRETVPTSQSPANNDQAQLSEQEIQVMPISKILELASHEETPRKDLERIASVRFGVTKGGLSVLRNRDALREKIRTLVSNEDTHESITRAAGQQGTSRS